MKKNPPEGLDPRKILVVKPSSLGDIVHSLPFLSALKRRFNDAEVHWVVAKGFEGLLEGHPMIDRLWVINKDQWKKLSRATQTLKEFQSIYKGLRAEKFDLAVDLQGLLRSGLIMMASKAPVRVGFDESQEGSLLCYTDTVGGRNSVHAVESYLKISSYLGCKSDKPSFPMPTSKYPLPFDGDYAVLVPGARWRTKRWSAERFARLASKLSVKTIVVGGKGDIPLGKKIAARSGGMATSLAGKTDLKELSYVIKHAKFAVTNDSGPMHFAAAHGVPVFAIFGPSSPGITGPYGEGHTIISKNTPCAPCFKKRCRNIKCMDYITVSMVLQNIEKRFPQ